MHPGVGGSARRRERSRSADALVRSLLHQAMPESNPLGFAVMAVGGYGRDQLSPHSDLDLVILHNGCDALAERVNAILYPLWDAGRSIDHSVRTPTELVEVISADLKALLGMLDARHIAGDESLTTLVAARAGEMWRATARRSLPELRGLSNERWTRNGELAYLLEPDLKQARGGLRDIAAMRAIAATWVADLPHAQVDAAELLLLDIRDALHEVAGRRGDRLTLHHQDAVAAALGLSDADTLMATVAEAARSIDLASTLTWRSVDRSLATPRRAFVRRQPIRVRPLGDGVGELYGELVLTSDADLLGDPLLLLRAAAVAAMSSLPLSPDLCSSLADNQFDLVWNAEARDLLISLIGAGPGLVPVWEMLDHHRIIEKWFPEWVAVRNRPQRNALHRHTVDRHMIETAVEAASLIRTVPRPDLLLLAALFHDLGKGHAGDHSDIGAPLVRALVQRLGFGEADSVLLAFLVRHHLTLAAQATRRDLEDPQTITDVLAVVEPFGMTGLQLLHALTIADGRATGAAGWSDWKARLVADLAARVASRLSGNEPAPRPTLTIDEMQSAERGEVRVSATSVGHEAEITVIAPDRSGLLALVAGVLTLARLDVRSARTLSHGAGAVMRWSVLTERHGESPDIVKIKRDLESALGGELDVKARVDARYRQPSTSPLVAAPVVVLTESGGHQIIEVRAHDRPGLLHVLARTLHELDIDIASAVVSTLGAEACDTFYVLSVRQPDIVRDRLLSVLS